MFVSPQVWPDFPDVVVDPSLDWDSQVEVRAPLCIFVEGFLGPRSLTQVSGNSLPWIWVQQRINT